MSRIRIDVRVPLALAASALLPGAAAAQPASAQHVVPTPLAESEEIRLARSAATPDISADADVWVLRDHGFERVVSGTNGWSCIVERDHPDSLAPLCYDPEGTRTMIPWVTTLEQLRRGGLSYDAAADSADALLRAGALPTPTRAIVAFMLSRHQKLHASPTGPAVGAWKPHVMVFAPDLTPSTLHLPGDHGVIMLAGEKRVLPYLVVPVEKWSDGTVAR